MASVPTETSTQPLAPLPPEQWPSVEHLVIEDGKPVDNLFHERQMRLLVQPLYESWAGPGAGRGFVAMANVGLFYSVDLPPLVPDVLLSIDVSPPKIDFEVKRNYQLAYFSWIYGKMPDVVIEIVSNRKGGETRGKRQNYHRMRIPHYVVYDPWQILSGESLQVLDWWPNEYRPAEGNWLSEVRLGLTVWKGPYEGLESEVWLRWCNRKRELLLTGAEIAPNRKSNAPNRKSNAPTIWPNSFDAWGLNLKPDGEHLESVDLPHPGQIRHWPASHSRGRPRPLRLPRPVRPGPGRRRRLPSAASGALSHLQHRPQRQLHQCLRRGLRLLRLLPQERRRRRLRAAARNALSKDRGNHRPGRRSDPHAGRDASQLSSWNGTRNCCAI